ncbi:Predicted arabinose efflux permease, MFS family [Rhodococcus rhodochrous J3]|uniref:Predicted arabinose efflux permease, MFS family n=1 Tax=Rhodococcus rhodochrous J3 TaxID=903528 RepID=A0ABY1MCI7_RHORH|nr:MFS transporter [Rhodococcus rhodochrous]MBF4481106.1 MHS family MFS transporter [Rhodococcus rhodochrous]MCB8912434.1 MHS family MFS transporter [Rhodococcus rhodochrous]TWH63190.1 putative MFS family arabinose efflux permease [Rhodococcus rhodochrous J38]SMG44961.1 Predicted arabinose efflux permease, MFS family [Rhodococcus rhodochrous J3]
MEQPASAPTEETNTARDVQSPPSGDIAQLRKVTLSSLLGTTIEYYDFLLYSTMAALVFGDLFFPSSNSAVSTIAAFGTLAAGYVARPLGGLVFGHFGDRLGRKSMLVITMVMMGIASFAIGILPTYEQIGMLAPVLLVTLRVVQGVAVGGEWGGAALMVAEHSDDRRRGLWTGLMQLGSPIGFLLSTSAVMLATLLPDASFESWGWRLPFIASAALLAIGLYVRMSVVESPVFEQAAAKAEVAAEAKPPVLQLLRRPRPLVLACAVGIGPFAMTALITSHIIAYTTSVGYSSSTVMRVLVLMSVVSIVTIPGFSALSDRVGRRAVSLTGAAVAVLYAFPLYMMINTGSIALLTVALLFGQVVQSAMYAPLAPMLSEMFGTDVRYTGVSFGYQFASLIGAGFTPMIAASLLVASDGSSLPLSLILVGTACVTILAAWIASETRGKNLAATRTEQN